MVCQPNIYIQNIKKVAPIRKYMRGKRVHKNAVQINRVCMHMTIYILYYIILYYILYYIYLFEITTYHPIRGWEDFNMDELVFYNVYETR